MWQTIVANVANLEDPVIFIVDDDEAVRESLKLLLETHGMEVEAYASTETFARSYRPHARQCLILDQHLQGMKTGLEFLASPERAAMRLPVILVTGRGDNEIKARALDAGVADYLDKPIDGTQLVAAIDRAIAAA
jgi:two-component system response regulator FixJ